MAHTESIELTEKVFNKNIIEVQQRHAKRSINIKDHPASCKRSTNLATLAEIKPVLY